MHLIADSSNPPHLKQNSGEKILRATPSRLFTPQTAAQRPSGPAKNSLTGHQSPASVCWQL